MPQTEAEFLRDYDPRRYDLPLASVDLAIFSLHEGALQVLLVERGEFPCKDQWALPGGYVDAAADRALEDTAVRKLREKTGVLTPYIEQVVTVGGADRDPRGWSLTVLYMALITHAPTLAHVAQVKDARWWPWEQARRLPLAFDHSHLLVQARERLQHKTAYTALPVFVLPPPFTLSALQKAFEVLLDAPLEKKSFRRRMEEADLLETAGDEAAPQGRGRPAALFRPRDSARHHLFSRVLGEQRAAD